MAYMLAYNFQRPLKALKYKSPYDKIIEIYGQKSQLFHFNPIHKIVGLNKYCNIAISMFVGMLLFFVEMLLFFFIPLLLLWFCDLSGI